MIKFQSNVYTELERGAVKRKRGVPFPGHIWGKVSTNIPGLGPIEAPACVPDPAYLQRQREDREGGEGKEGTYGSQHHPHLFNLWPALWVSSWPYVFIYCLTKREEFSYNSPSSNTREICTARRTNDICFNILINIILLLLDIHGATLYWLKIPQKPPSELIYQRSWSR